MPSRLPIVCRANGAGGITIDPSTIDPTTGEPTGVIQDSFATVASNVCVANKGRGIHTIHAGYLAVRGNIWDGNENAGVAIVSSRYAVVADNVVTGNGTYGVGFWGDPDDVPDDTPDLGHHRHPVRRNDRTWTATTERHDSETHHKRTRGAHQGTRSATKRHWGQDQEVGEASDLLTALERETAFQAESWALP